MSRSRTGPVWSLLQSRRLVCGRYNWSYFDVAIALVFVVAMYILTSESRAYLGEDYCAIKKGADRCSDSVYRWKKFAQKLGDPLHVVLSFVFLPLTKNSIFHAVLGGSFERAILWHKVLAKYVLILGSALHGGFFVFKWVFFPQTTFFKALTAEKNIYGFFALGISLITLFFAQDHFRRNYYNIFRILHVSALPLYLLFLRWHYHGEQLFGKLFVPLALLGVDLLFRLRNLFSRYEASIIEGPKPVGKNITMFRVRMKQPMRNYVLGQYAFIAIPDLSRFELKPLTLIPLSKISLSSSLPASVSNSDSTEDDASTGLVSNKYSNTEFEILVKKSSTGDRWSDRILKVLQPASRGVGGHGNNYYTVLLDGPYGSLSLPYELSRYNSVTMFAGGIGVTPFLALLADPCVSKYWTLVWSVRDKKLLRYCLPRLVYSNATIKIHLTHTTDLESDFLPNFEDDEEERYGDLPAKHVSKSRPDIAWYINEAIGRSKRNGMTAILVCGPESMKRDATIAYEQHAVNMDMSGNGRIHFHAETFEW